MTTITPKSIFHEPIQSYTYKDFISQVHNKVNSLKFEGFDGILWEFWRKAEASGALNYKTNDVVTKVLPGKFSLVAQLNPARAKKRRKPHPFSRVVENFDSLAFNFTKIKNDELLFNIKIDVDDANVSQGSVIVNTAPISDCHCLLLPSPLDCLPQVLDEQGMLLALSFVFLSSSRCLRVGFNSLCAYASVNHYHFHCYYLQQNLLVETAPCSNVGGACYAFTDHYAPGFVFQVTLSTLLQQLKQIMKLVHYLVSHGVPHNVFMTRGARLSPEPQQNSQACYDAVRVCVWARETTIGAKEVTVFAPALCELAGHVPIYSNEQWDSLQEKFITDEIERICYSTYSSILPEVKKLFL